MKKRILSMLLALAMVVGLLPDFAVTASAAEVSGTTGDCTWTFDDSTGTLTISGSGAVGGDQSWIEHVNSITSIVIEDGITVITNYAFYQCASLKSVMLPASLTKIGNYAFTNCSNLASVTIPASVTTIGNSVFYGCSSLTTVNYLGTSEPSSMGDYIFNGCGLTTVNVPDDYAGDTFGGLDVSKTLVDEPAPTTYPIWVGDEQVTSAKLSGTGWAYDPDTNTLTLNNYTYTGTGYSFNNNSDAAIYYGGTNPLNLELVGDNNRVTHSGNKDGYSYGIYVNDNIEISGTGSLTATGGAGAFSYGVSTKDITISGSSSLTATGGTADLQSYGMRAKGSIIVNGGSLSATGGGDGHYSYGVSAGGGITISGSGSLTATGGTATYNSNGVYTDGDITISGSGSLSATGGNVTINDSYGVSANGGITINGGETIVQGNTSACNVAPSIDGALTVYDADDQAIANPVWTGTGALTYAKIAEKPADPATTHSVRISAVDATDGWVLSGAHLQILDEKGEVIVIEGSKVEWDSTEAARTVTGLKTGVEYTLRATVAPKGYIIPDDITFTIDQAGNITPSGTVTNGVISIRFEETAVEIKAVNKAGGAALAGAHLQILEKAGGNEVVRDEWDSTEEAWTVTGLKTGVEHILRATKAPDGYAVPADTTFTLDYDGKVSGGTTKTKDGVLLVEFEEIPDPDPVIVTLGLTKSFNDWSKAPGGFDFNLVAVTANAPLPEKTSAKATKDMPMVSFGTITFTEMGTYEYTITEVDSGITGITYDTNPHSVVVTVTKDAENNKLVADVTYDGEASLIITNTYTAPVHTVTFVDGNGNVIDSQTVKHGEAATAPADPTREGYTFDGWDQAFDNVTSDLTITAKWKVNQYSIIYMIDGTIEYTRITKNYGENVVAIISNPIREGYTFSGWSQSMPTTMPAHDVIITGSFTVNQYTITFDTDGGTAVAPIKQDYNTAVTAPADPTKTGYTFAGWDKTIPETMPAKNITIKAKWNINQHTITFDTDGGSAIAPITQDYGTAVTAPAAPTKTGYSFAGWDKQIPANMPAGDMTIKALWNVNKYDIVYMVDGVEHARIKDVAYGTAITPIAKPTKTGYTFSGWSAIPATMPDEDVVINGTFTVKSYRIDWMVKGHQADGSTAGYKWTDVNYGEPIIPPQMVWDKEGYLFSGWQNVPETMPAEDIIIYGEWIKNFGTITWMVDGETYATTTATYGKPITLLEAPEKTGYTFNGWKNIPATMPQTDLTIEADITANIYQINWYANGGWFFNQSYLTSTVSNQTFGTVIQAPANNAYVRRTGYTFSGWNTKADGTGEWLDANTVMDQASNTAVIYYAQWNANAYTITFDTDGGSAVAPITQDYGTAVAAPAAPTKTGYTFAGWDKEIPANMPAENVTITAQWEKTEYTADITQPSGGEVETNNPNPTMGDKVTITVDPEPGMEVDKVIVKDEDDKDVPVTENPDGTYTYEQPAGDVEIEVTMKETEFENEVTQPSGGDIETSDPNPTMGDKVTITVDPDPGKRVDEVVVKDKDGNPIEVTKNPDGTYSYEQPIGEVTIEVTFENIPSDPTYRPTIEDSTGGNTTVSDKNPEKGDKVTISTDPDRGYVVGEIIVTDRKGNEVEVIDNGDGTYTFKQPAGKVTITVTYVPKDAGFVDVEKTSYYYDAVNWAVANGITNGTSATTFSPNAVCTRAQVVTFLWRAAGRPEPKSTQMPFADIPADVYYYKAVLWAIENGITNGTSATTFSPDATVTRGQAVTFLWRSEHGFELDGDHGFHDVHEDAYYHDAVLWAVRNEVTNGTSKTTFSPDNGCTRGQIVTFMYRAMAE